MLDVVLDALIDSLKVFGIAFLLYFLFSFIHNRITTSFQKHKGISPLLGASVGLIPECGISVVGADMYQKKQISMGTILAIFFACSDEAFFILCSDYKKALYVLPLLAVKWVFGMLLGYFVDAIYRKKELVEVSSVRVDCCEHHHHEKNQAFSNHFLHPLLHCLKIFVYVFVVNLLFGILVYMIGEEQILNFLSSNEALAPIFAGLIGLIPNCAASVLMSELFLLDGLSFGALVTGLSVNAGVGIIYLLRFKETRKEALWMIGILFIYALCIGYIIYGIMKGVQ